MSICRLVYVHLLHACCLSICIFVIVAIITSMILYIVVTGSTDGIGKAYAEELARQGLNIVLIGCSEGKLRVAEAIGEMYSRRASAQLGGRE